MEINNNKFLVIYCYYEIKNYQKNQTNLSFFIRHGMNNKKWKNLDVEYLFVINGHQCEVLIPILPNVHILNEDNCSDWEGWYNGINYIKNKFMLKNIRDKFDYIFFMNCSVYGPFIDSSLNSHWLEPYYDKIQKENSIICSNIITSLPNNDLGGPGFRCSAYSWLIKVDNIIIDILTNEYISNVCPGSTQTLTTLNRNTVLGFKIDKMDAILTGEYGLSRLILQHGYKMSCLIYNYEEYINDDKLNNNLHQDRYKTYNRENLKLEDVIFYKNNWRVLDNSRASLPVEYDKCNDYDLKISKMTKIIIDDVNYNELKCSEIGKNLNFKGSDWNSKKYFYDFYGYAEEIITFPKFLENNKAIAIYHHHDSENIIKDYTLQALKCLIMSGYDIYFCTSCTAIKNVNLPFEVHYYQNYGAGTDFIVYYEVIKNNLNYFKEKYEWIFITNDSVIFPINGVDHFKNVVNAKRSISTLWGHWSSSEINNHLIGTLIEFNICNIGIFYNFLFGNIGDYLTNSKDKLFYILEVEVKLLEYMINLGINCSVVIDHKKYNYSEINDVHVHNSPFNPFNFYKWLEDPDCFAVKWKYMANYMNLEKINKPYLNYLMRYLHFGSNGPIYNYESVTGLDPKKIVEIYS